MEVLGIAASALQVAAYCAQVTLKIVKWVGEVRTVDARIAAFYDGVVALQGTYDGLEKTLKIPAMEEAARAASKTSDGYHLWTQLRLALDDSKKTMLHVNLVLDDINNAHGIGRKIKKQLLESLKSGELGRLNQQIAFFNSTISLPIQMMTVWLQIEQRDINADSQRHLYLKLSTLEKTIRDLASSLDERDGVSAIGSSTLVASSDKDLQSNEEIKKNVRFASQFLSTASAAASTRSAASDRGPFVPTRMPTITSSAANEPHDPLAVQPTAGEKESRIPDWIAAQVRSETHSSAPLTRKTDSGSGTSSDEDDEELSFTFAQRHLTNGHTKAEQGNHAAAERCFRKVLALLETHNFGNKLSHEPADVADVVLKLSESCMKQSKLSEAMQLLEPVAQRRVNVFPSSSGMTGAASDAMVGRQKPNRLQALAASHMLGEVHLRNEDPDIAEIHGLKAFKGRTKSLGKQHAKTLESVQLMIDIYTVQGDEEEVEVYEEFLREPIPEEETIDPLDRRESGELPSEPFLIPSQTSMPQASNRRSITSRLPWRARTSPSIPNGLNGVPIDHLPPISRHSTLNQESSHLLPSTTILGPPLMTVADRKFSSISSPSTLEKTSSTNDDMRRSDSISIARSPTIQNIEPHFGAIRSLCSEGKYKMAMKRALNFLETYDPQSKLLLPRTDEFEKNLKRGGRLGLAATGYGYAPIHFFCELRQRECVDEVEFLVRDGADVNAVAYKAGLPGHNPIRPLQLAIRNSHASIAKIILAQPTIKTDFKDPDGYTPLLLACRRECHSIVEQLLNHESYSRPSEYPSKWYGNTLLHDAARQCDRTLVAILLQRPELQADINVQDKYGKTPLIYAVMKRDIPDLVERSQKMASRMPTVLLLLGCKADVNLKDSEGMTAADYARDERDPELVELLQEGDLE